MVALTLAKVAGGGVLVGLACGIVAIVIAWRTSDHLVETALTAVAAYGSFLLAESFHLSGVLATVAAGLLMGNLGVLVEEEERAALTSHGREFVVAFWEFAAFIANSLVFLLIGLRVAGMAFAECRLGGRSGRHPSCAGGSGSDRLPDLHAIRALTLGGSNA